MVSKLISFKLDPVLDRLWISMGYNNTEKAAEIKNLENCLIQAYTKFIEDTNEQYFTLRSDLKSSIEEFHHVQVVFGDDSDPPQLLHTQSLREQIDVMNKAINEIKSRYQPIVDRFEELHEKIKGMYDILKVDEEHQGEFAQVGFEDLTTDRLERFKNIFSTLSGEIEQRTNIFDSVSSQIIKICEHMEEDMPEDIDTIIKERMIDNQSINRINSFLKDISVVYNKQVKMLDDCWAETVNYYEMLEVADEERLAKPSHPTLQNIQYLREENDFLHGEIETRLPIVTKSLNVHIKNICDQLKVPNKLRPTYTGSDMVKESLFLKSELDKLRDKLIKAQPILQVISELEEHKRSLDLSGTSKQVLSRERGTSRKLAEDDRRRRSAKENIPKLQQKLLKLLAQFKEENGYDFEFEGLEVLGNILDVNDESINSKSVKQSLGKTILMQKLKDSNVDDSANKTQKSKLRFGVTNNPATTARRGKLQQF